MFCQARVISDKTAAFFCITISLNPLQLYDRNFCYNVKILFFRKQPLNVQKEGHDIKKEKKKHIKIHSNKKKENSPQIKLQYTRFGVN